MKRNLPKYSEYGCVNIQELEQKYNAFLDKMYRTYEKIKADLDKQIKKDDLKKKATKILKNIDKRKKL